MDRNGHKSGFIKEGAINELGEVTYTKNDQFDDGNYPTFEEIVANEVLKRVYGTDLLSIDKLKDEAYNKSRERLGIQKQATPTEPPIERPGKSRLTPDPKTEQQKTISDGVKIGVNVKELTDDEFIEFTKKRVQSNKDFERFKSIKAKIRSTLEGRSYNEKAFNMFIKLHDIDKRGFFNRSKEDDEIISEAIKLYGSV